MQRALVAICILLAACSSTPQHVAETASPAPTTALAPALPSETEAQALDRIRKSLADSSIYFDYDNYSIKHEYQLLLQKDSELLKSGPQLAVRLEGNADERGSREYNLALGQKRAEAARRALILLGVPETRLEATSFGKEKPRAQCHEDRCWTENRRVDLVAKRPDGA